MNLKLVKLSIEYKDLLCDLLDEWTQFNRNHPEQNRSPGAIFANDYHNFDYYMNNIDVITNPKYVPASTFFCLDIDRNIFVGAISIRHYLNDNLRLYGGHIGDGIRPSERRKGYATAMIALALKECKKLNLDKVLMICDKDNIGSKKSIENNGGVFDSEGIEDGKPILRYWINID